MSTDKPAISGGTLPGLFASAFEYLVDTGQRSVLFLDVMRQRGVQYSEHIAKTAPHVLDYDVELIVDGRNFKRPVNYGLVRVAPPSGVTIDIGRRPFVVVDPRAGHGPGIGGFKADSEIGVAMKAGHPCYFIGFLPEPMPGQTIEDVARAEAIFIEEVIALHPDADGKPCVIGNCAGWLGGNDAGFVTAGAVWTAYHRGRAVVLLGRRPRQEPDALFGRPARRKFADPFTSDLGGGRFDGAWLVQNFENMNPSNTLWTKQYNVYSKIDTETDRSVDFERWWGGHCNLNAEESSSSSMSYYIGNNLAAEAIETSDGRVVDLRNICSPIVVLLLKGRQYHAATAGARLIFGALAMSMRLCARTGEPLSTPLPRFGQATSEYSSRRHRREHSKLSSNIDLIEHASAGFTRQPRRLNPPMPPMWS